MSALNRNNRNNSFISLTTKVGKKIFEQLWMLLLISVFLIAFDGLYLQRQCGLKQPDQTYIPQVDRE